MQKEQIKKRVYEVIEVSSIGDASSRAYDVLMTTAVIVGMIPLTLKSDNSYTYAIEMLTTLIFVIDYVSRVWTADYKMGYKSFKAYIAYILSPMALFDFLSIVPVIYLFTPVGASIGLLKLFRAFRVLKLIRYSKTAVVIANVLRKVKKELLAVLILIIIYIFVSAMLIFQLEPDLFANFFDALYWATISITTIGYGDIYPTTNVGRLITMVSALVGVAVIALPSGMITAAYISEISRKKSKYEL
ncbi:ion transporter [Butyrivibrio sp. INlla14]|uniref:ion transporter n=1 Tax=Butyrivibrio sp. INlla14 TaxID=1520808 RepID=UPI0008771BBE|nr:ion transporter [Butyrivibrio sp. INlla14]SCY27562.1 voltage-gated potassium channel [Butyrivibrio sp. INlla14]